MFRFIVHDTRLVGYAPAGAEIEAIKVDAGTLLSSFIQKAMNASERKGKEISIEIMSHGEDTGGDLICCKEHIKLSTVNQFLPLQGGVKGGIVIYSCRAAMIAKGKANQDGDGNMLCSRLAQVVRTTVKASTALQEYSFSRGKSGGCNKGPIVSPIEWGEWEGTVLTYGPEGNVIDVENHPAGTGMDHQEIEVDWA